MFHAAVDHAYSRYAARRPMFAAGWGDEKLLARFEPTEVLARSGAPAEIEWEGAPPSPHGDAREGRFAAGLDDLPAGCRAALVRHLGRPGNRSAVVLLAGSREEGFAMRERVYGPLVSAGIDLLILENPYYGARRPFGAASPSAPTVADQVQMNVASLVEALSLLSSARERYARVGVAGYSMGGHMAALAGALYGGELAIAAFATGACPSPIYTRGLLSRSVAFDALGPRAAERLCALFDRGDLARLPPPARPRAAALVAMAHDGYVSRGEVERLADHWRGASIRFEDAGHVTGVVLRSAALRRAVASAFDQL